MTAVAVVASIWLALAAAQTRTDRSVALFSCKDVMREPSTGREVAIAFLHGYFLAKAGGEVFNVEALERQTNAFIEECLNSPQKRAIDVMEKIKK